MSGTPGVPFNVAGAEWYPARCSICDRPTIDPNVYTLVDHGIALLLGTRCASTSIKRAILDSVGEVNAHPHSNTWLLSRHGEKPADRSFVFVRHPYARAYSTWCKMVHITCEPHMACFGFAEGDSWIDFCRKLVQADPIRGDLHIRPISSNLGTTAWDICRFETLGQDWARVQAASLITLPELTRLRSSDPIVVDLDEYELGCELLRDYYAADFAAFGYAP